MPKSTPQLPLASESPRPTFRGGLKWLLMAMVLCMLGLMLWQLRAEFRQQQDNFRQAGQNHGEQVANQFALRLELRAQTGMDTLRQHALRPAPGEQSHKILKKLQAVFPSLLSLAWINPQGGIIADSSADSSDAAFIASLPAKSQDQPYYLTSGPQADSPIYMLVRQPEGVRPGGFWLGRMDHQILAGLFGTLRNPSFNWQIEAPNSHQVLAHNPTAQATNLTSISLIDLPRTNLQLRNLLDEQQLRLNLLPSLIGKLLVFIGCAVLTLVTLLLLLRELRRLSEQNSASRRELYQAAAALHAIEERVIVTNLSGHIRYINSPAKRLLGLPFRQIRGRLLGELIPAVQRLVWNSASDPQEATAQIIQWPDSTLLLSVNRSELPGDQLHGGYVWVLRDVTAEQQSRRIINESRRRYQDIFEGTGSPLCVLDLTQLHSYLLAREISTGAALEQWLVANPQSHSELLQCLRLTDANQTALRLFGVSDLEQAWQLLVTSHPLRIGGIRQRIMQATLEGPQLLEMESRAVTAQGHERFLWLTLRIPEHSDNLSAVTLAINDITSRKRIELSLIERERFWSDVVRSVPDTLYIHDIPGKRVMFSNNRLGPVLGYSKDELRVIGDKLWEKILHPDDSELYGTVRSAQQVLGEGQLLQFQLRWRHRDGSWHWFDIREHAMSRDDHGRVSRLIGVAKDITAQIAANEALRESERRYRLLAESTTDVIFSTDRNLKLNYVSSAAEPMFGRSPEWILQHGLFGMVANPKQMTGVHSLLKSVQKAVGQPTLLAEMRNATPSRLFNFDYFHADGRKIPAELNMSLMWDDNDNFAGLLGVGRDISLQRRADKDMRMAATVFEHSTAAIAITDPAGYIAQVNQTFSRITGYSPADVLDQLPSMLSPDKGVPEQFNFILGRLNQHGSWEGELWMRRKNAENYPAWVGITAVKDDEGDLVSYVYFFSDISERKASEQRIHRLAYYDILTQIPNRSLFQDRLHTSLQKAQRNNSWVALMFLDLDRFKPINDSLGHAAGDLMLKEVAVRLSACVGADDTVARMGGDEFTLLLQANTSHEATLNRAIHVGEQILASLSRAFILEGREFFVTASIGIAISPQDGNESSLLMKNADTAMYHAKERGKNNFQFYQADMNARALERLELESELRHALELKQFVLYYQPQFANDGLRLSGVEALLRWQHPQRGLVPPGEFIPVLEELGLVEQVGDWVLSEACQQFTDWRSRNLAIEKMSVNLSARQFKDGQLAQRIETILRDSGMPPSALELELTESILMGNADDTLLTLAQLKQLGLCIAVDDFGTGYSSLNYLKQFPIDVLKIDRSFVDGLPDGEQDAQIARAIIAMAHSLNLKVIAEGVETQAQLDFLRQHDCDEVQGFLLGRPLPAHELEQQLKRRTP